MHQNLTIRYTGLDIHDEDKCQEFTDVDQTWSDSGVYFISCYIGPHHHITYTFDLSRIISIETFTVISD